MRVIAGTAKGRTLLSPAWLTTRPMMDRVKESIFSLIQPYLPQATILDLYAGTGALGIEALSRGAKTCTFNDSDRRCTELIQKNLLKTQLNDQASTTTSTAEKLITTLSSDSQHPPAFDIIFFCPPYNTFSLDTLTDTLNLCSSDGILIAEHHRRTKLPDPLKNKPIWKHRNFGQTQITIY